MKLGTENKTKTIAAAALGVLAIFMLVRAFTGGGEETSAPPAGSGDVPSKLVFKSPLDKPELIITVPPAVSPDTDMP